MPACVCFPLWLAPTHVVSLLTLSHLLRVQKMYRDHREEYDESIRAHVRQQLDL